MPTNLVQDATQQADELTQRERELGAIITAYNQVTEQLKLSHERLRDEVSRLHEELVRKNRQLRRRERLAALGEMAAGVAHEIRNPLGGIKLLTNLLDKDLTDRPEAHRLVRKVANGVHTVESIVTGILEFGRPRDPQPAVVELESLIRETLELAADRIAERRVRVEVQPQRPGLTLISDAGLIKQALLNLVLNAIDAAAGPGATSPAWVCISLAERPPGHLSIAVSDSGSGVPAELMDRIFNPFFTTKQTGTGLGLAIVHQTAEALGGSIQVAAGANGGAVFTLCLPLELPRSAEAGD